MSRVRVKVRKILACRTRVTCWMGRIYRDGERLSGIKRKIASWVRWRCRHGCDVQSYQRIKAE